MDWRYILLQEKGREASLDASQFFGIPLGPNYHCLSSMCSSLFSHSRGDESDQLVGFFGLFFLGMLSIWIEFQSDRELHRFRTVRSDTVFWRPGPGLGVDIQII